MRVAIGGLVHETNTYAVGATGLTALSAFTVLRGSELQMYFANTGWSVAGMLDEATRRRDEVVATVFSWAEPSGTIEATAYATLKEELLTALAHALPLEAVALELHGAGVAEGVDDLEADLGRAIRAVVGPVPVVATLDLHGNITAEMAAVYDALLGCHLYPHTDLYERGVEAVDLLHRIVDDGVRTVMHVESLPMLVPPATTDGDSPAARTNAACAELERREGILDCTFMHGFPFTDVPATGASIIAIADGDAALAAAAAKEAAASVWARRESFRVENDTPESAVRRAAAAGTFPVVINECSDNPGGGSPGDGTHLLRAMLEGRLSDSCFGFIADPGAVQRAIEAGVDRTIDVELGGHHDELHGRPLAVRGRVRCVTDGRVMLRAMMAGVELVLGPTCRLTVEGIDVVVTSNPWQTIDPEIFLLHGIDVTRCKVIGLKSSQHFRAGFRDLAALIITADSPGLTTNRVETFEHVRPNRALWPVDAEAAYP